MTASTAITALLGVAEGVLASGHLAHCPHGNWTEKYLPLKGYPEGSPCSPRCLAAQRAVALGRAWIAEHQVEQLRMEATG